MIKKIEIRSKNIFFFKEGTLYPILHALENEDYIESYWDSSQGARKRKYYKITTTGKKVLSEKEIEIHLIPTQLNILNYLELD